MSQPARLLTLLLLAAPLSAQGHDSDGLGQSAPVAPHMKGGGGQGDYLGPGSFCGLEETSFSDPDWIMMTSDRIVRSADCVAECEQCPECWYDLAPGPPCYAENRYWKFAEGFTVASAFPMGALGVGTFDGMYVKPGIEAQFYQGNDTQNPFGPLHTGPLYASIDIWTIACEGLEPGTFLVNGGAGALGEYSLTLNGGCKGRVRWENEAPIQGAIVTAYALTLQGSELVAVPVGSPEVTDPDGFYEVPDGMSRDTYPLLPGELGETRGVRASITYTEDTGIQVLRTITNYPKWDPLLPWTRKQTGTEDIDFPAPVIFQPGVMGTYNSGSADALRAFLIADPGNPVGLSSELAHIKQGRGFDSTVPAFLFWGMPSRDVFGPYSNDGVPWGYDNSAVQSAGSVADSADRLQAHIIAHVMPELNFFTPGPVPITMTGHSLGGIISRRWVSRYAGDPPLHKYVTFDAVHGGTRLIVNNFLPNLLNEILMNGFYTLFNDRVYGWNRYNSLASRGNTLLFASVDEHWVIAPSVSAFGIGRIFEQGLLGFSHSGECLRSVGGWELAVHDRGHSIQNEPEVFVSAGRFLAGYPPTLGIPSAPGANVLQGTFSGPPQNLCPAPLGTGGPTSMELFELSAASAAIDSANPLPGSALTAQFTATLIGDGTLTVHDSLGNELPKSNEVVVALGGTAVQTNFDVDLPLGANEVRLTGATTDALAYVQVSYPTAVSATASTDLAQYSLGTNVQISASMIDGVGTPLIGTSAGAEATVTAPDTSETLVALFDDGLHGDGAASDGVFGGTFVGTLQSGSYGVEAAITADFGGATHRRVDALAFAVLPASASFNGPIVESLPDADLNMLAEGIRLEFAIDALEDGEYLVQGVLVDDAAMPVESLSASVTVAGAPTSAVATIDIDALTLRRAGSGGPYTVEEIVLVDADLGLVTDARADYTTGTYLLSAFEPAPGPLMSHCHPADDHISGGDSILLYGQNLLDTTSVKVGAATAPSFTVVGDDSLLFTAPPGPEGPTTITVTTPWGSKTQQGLFRYVNDGSPVIVAPPTMVSDCVADSATFSVAVTGDAPLAYQWRLDGVDIAGATDPTLIVQPFGASDFGAYDVVVSNNLGMETSPDLLLVDCNGSGELDACDVELGTSQDCNANLVPDECDAAAQDCNANLIPDDCETDCNANSVPDDCDIANGTVQDCNANLVPDSCDLANGTSTDCNANGVPDECDVLVLDCNANLVPDSCDIDSGTSIDCDANGIPDECDVALLDCNANLVPDSCDIDSGNSLDCNLNGIPDECDVAILDCNANGVPDDCEIDCNLNGVPDDCDIASGTSQDCNANGIPDECDPDCNGDGIPDDCQGLLRIFVDELATGAGDGTGWSDAFTDLESAILVAENCLSGNDREIWVARGTYSPLRQTEPGVVRSSTFVLPAGVRLYGGFAGGETDLLQRDVVANPTILWGGLLGGVTSAYHVVTATGVTSAAVLDGFTIRRGNANLTTVPHDRGGGLLIEAASPTLRNLSFDDNRAALGGAVFVGSGSAPTFEDCAFVGAAGLNGNVGSTAAGALYVAGGATVSMTNSIFDGGRSNDGEGGAIYLESSSSLTLQTASFVDNLSDRGGAILAEGASLSLDDCVFGDCRAVGTTASEALGGVLYSRGASTVTMNRCVFDTNRAANGGAVVYALDALNLTVTSSRFLANSALDGLGGACYLGGSSSSSFVDCYLFANVADTGGAFYVDSGASAQVLASSLVENIAQLSGGGGVWTASAGLTLDSTLVWDNVGADSTEANQVFASAVPSIDYCAVEDWSGSIDPTGIGNVGTPPFDPAFVDAANDDYHLFGSSPLRDAGNPAFAVLPGELDCDGEPRLDGARIDIGCDEVTDCNLNLVPDYLDILVGTSADLDFDGVPDECNGDCNGNGVPDVDDISNGTSQDCNANGIPDECDIASGASLDFDGSGVPDECETGIVFYVDDTAVGAADGTSWIDAFLDVQDALDAIEQTGAQGAQVWIASGTYAPTRETQAGVLRSASFSLTEHTSLYGGFAGTESSLAERDIDSNPTTLTGNLGTTSAYHVVTIVDVPAVVLNGLVVSGGNANSGSAPDERGGGLYVANSAPVLRHMTLNGHSADLGGALYVDSSSSLELHDSSLVSNSAGLAGGALYLASGSSATIRRSSFLNNNATGDEGGAVYLEAGSLLDARATSFDTGRAARGGSFFLDGAGLVLTRCTLFDNRATGGGATESLGGSVHAVGASSIELVDTLIDAGRAREGAAIRIDGTTDLVMERTELRSQVAANGLGAGLYLTGSTTTTLRNCYLVDNRATDTGSGLGDGGGIFLTGSAQAALIQSTICDNGATSGDGAGLYVSVGTQVDVDGCILWANRSQNGFGAETDQLFFEPSASGSSVDYSCVTGWTGTLPVIGANNVGGGGFDPLFAGPANLNYRLRWNSPCVDIGDPAYSPAVDETDFDGEPRLFGGRIDMGFDEVRPRTKGAGGASNPQVGG